VLGRAYPVNLARVFVRVSVREIQPRDVHAGANEPLQHLGRFRRRPDSGDDLRLVIGEGHAFAPCRAVSTAIFAAP
jgi:hypothetical protein